MKCKTKYKCKECKKYKKRKKIEVLGRKQKHNNNKSKYIRYGISRHCVNQNGVKVTDNMRKTKSNR